MKGILLTAYGSPGSPGEVEPYFTHIRGGRKPGPGELADLVARYERIGGGSPLQAITQRQAEALGRALGGSGTAVYAGMKHSRPFIGDVVRRARSEGVDEMLVIPLAPHYSKMSVGGYAAAVEKANSELPSPMKIDLVRSWHDLPQFVDAWARRIGRAAEGFGGFHLLYSAHSLPERILGEGDPYRDELMKTCELINGKARPERWSFAFQSAGGTGEGWLGPDVLEHLDGLAARGERRFLMAPIGFVSDHLEILYDIDVECVELATSKGAELRRCPSFNDSEDFVECLVALAEKYGYA
ncbi:MAG: ferrochelatase [Nitrososphaerota archaeon]|nr:ferrochelatase [Nitrososphaerota archaeon]